MKADVLFKIIGSDFYTGVPDSQLRALCDCLIDRYGIDGRHHIIAANEGNSVGIAAGYHMATGKIPVVYMQNSGEGNVINPVASLLNEKVYAIPMFFIIGWRGEPGIHDEPQHIYQGEVTVRLLDDMGIDYYIIGSETSEEEVQSAMDRFKTILSEGHQAAFVVRKGALTYEKKVKYSNDHILKREEVIKKVVEHSAGNVIISTTGKASRELFEIREQKNNGHENDFLTVGSMGHSSSIALGIALSKPDERVWCIDGDGAVLMHMGAMAVIGASAPKKFVHIVINNGAHESVGGMPTVAGKTDFVKIAYACGYSYAVRVKSLDELETALSNASEYEGTCFIEVLAAIGSRSDLGRPTTTPLENKRGFMMRLSSQ